MIQALEFNFPDETKDTKNRKWRFTKKIWLPSYTLTSSNTHYFTRIRLPRLRIVIRRLSVKTWNDLPEELRSSPST